MSEHKSILILGEIEGGVIASITRELLGIGRVLADELKEELSVLFIGSDLKAVGQDAIAWGADQVFLVDNPLFAEYNGDCYTEVLTRICREKTPDIVLAGHTSIGRDIAPRVAARLKVSLAVDCIELKIAPDTKKLLQTRPVYGGNAVAVTVSKTIPQMATVRPKSMPLPGHNPSRTGKVTPVPMELNSSIIKTKVINRVKEQIEGIKLEDAQVIVAGGGGITSAEGFVLLRELAKVLGGAVGATRIPCEEGLISSSLQIGQTGKIVTPDLYIAVAISGAPQHIAGCSAAKIMVAINKDPEANMFKLADFGVVGEYEKAIPALIARCKELLSR